MTRRRLARRIVITLGVIAWLPWLIEWARTRRPLVPANLPRFARPQIGRLQP